MFLFFGPRRCLLTESEHTLFSLHSSIKFLASSFGAGFLQQLVALLNEALALFFRCTHAPTLCRKISRVPLARVSRSHIDDRVDCHAHNVGQVLVPSRFVHAGLVDQSLAGICHDPIAVHKTLDPDVISEIGAVARLKANGTAVQTKEIRILSATTLARLQQFTNRIVTWKCSSVIFTGRAVVNYVIACQENGVSAREVAKDTAMTSPLAYLRRARHLPLVLLPFRDPSSHEIPYQHSHISYREDY